MKEIKVNDMTCMNCVRKIQMGFNLENIKVDINLEKHALTVAEANVDKAVQIVEKLGYTPEV